MNIMQSRNTGPGGKNFRNKTDCEIISKNPMFKKEYKKELVILIGRLREMGGSYSEIRDYLNENAQRTPNNKIWSSSYVYTFYNKNKAENPVK